MFLLLHEVGVSFGTVNVLWILVRCMCVTFTDIQIVRDCLEWIPVVQEKLIADNGYLDENCLLQS